MKWQKLCNPFVISHRDRTWWKNLQGGAPVTLSGAGHEVQVRGESFTACLE